jgi:hypothetical protein
MTKLKCYVDWIVCDRKIHDQFEVLFKLEQMREDDVLTKFEVPSYWNRYEFMLS